MSTRGFGEDKKQTLNLGLKNVIQKKIIHIEFDLKSKIYKTAREINYFYKSIIVNIPLSFFLKVNKMVSELMTFSLCPNDK